MDATHYFGIDLSFWATSVNVFPKNGINVNFLE